MAYNAAIEISFEMIDYPVASVGEVYTYWRTYTQLNKADFDGNPLFYFEIVVDNSNPTTAYSPILYDVTNGVEVASVSVAANTTVKRFRSTSFTPAAGEVVYAIRTPSTASTYQIKVWAGRIIVVQNNTATKTVIDFPLLGASYGQSSLDNSHNTRVNYGVGLTYSQSTTGYWSRWYKDASKWATVSGCALDGVVCGNGAAQIGYMGLCDKDNGNTLVTGAEISITGTVPGHGYAEFNWSSLPDSHTFELYAKNSTSGQPGFVFRACLRIKMSDLQKGEVYRRIGLYNAATNESSHRHIRQKYTAASFTSPTVYFECNGSCTDNATAIQVAEISSDDGDPTSIVTGSSINWNSGTKSRIRTSAITPTTNYTIAARGLATTGTQTVVNPLLVIAFQGVLSGAGVPKKSTFVVFT